MSKPPGLTIALSKGRIFKEALPLLATAGILPSDDPASSRKLVLDTNREEVKLVIIRAQDVPTYVEYGAADLGVAGKDVLLEYGGDGLYEPLDLGIARCRMMAARQLTLCGIARHHHSASCNSEVQRLIKPVAPILQ